MFSFPFAENRCRENLNFAVEASRRLRIGNTSGNENIHRRPAIAARLSRDGLTNQNKPGTTAAEIRATPAGGPWTSVKSGIPVPKTPQLERSPRTPSKAAKFDQRCDRDLRSPTTGDFVRNSLAVFPAYRKYETCRVSQDRCPQDIFIVTKIVASITPFSVKKQPTLLALLLFQIAKRQVIIKSFVRTSVNYAHESWTVSSHI